MGENNAAQALHLVSDEGAVTLLRVDVYRRLREDILACRLPPGQDLREAELAERFAVSKSPVRDALIQLVQEGLVAVMPRQGYRVAPISLKDVRDMFQFRAVLEAAVARLCVATADQEALDALERFRQFDPQRHSGGFIQYNREFHGALSALAGNARLGQSTRALVELMDRVVQLSVNAVRHRDTSSLVAEHVAMIDALQARDARRAERLARAHVERAEKRVCAALGRLIE